MINLLTLIKNLFKIARLLSVDDSGDLRIATLSALGKKQTALLFTPYGLMHNPPVDSLALLWNQQAQSSNGIAMADSPNTRIFKDLKEGEVAVGNYMTGDYLFFNEGGSSELLTNKLNIVTPEVETTGSLIVGSGENAVFVTLLGQIITASNGIIVDVT
jgi:phage gp45-like